MPRIEPFEKYCNEYDQWFESHNDLYQAELIAIRQVMPAEGLGVEVGIGSGKFALPLGIRFGLDPSGQILGKAKLLGIDVILGIAEKLPFAAAWFDYVLMVTTICFVDDLLQSFKEGLRVLKPGGSIIIGFVDKESELGRRYTRRKESSKFYRQAAFYSTSDVLSRLVQSGFQIVTTIQTLIPGEPAQKTLEGTGKGSFVVIKALKKGIG